MTVMSQPLGVDCARDDNEAGADVVCGVDTTTSGRVLLKVGFVSVARFGVGRVNSGRAISLSPGEVRDLIAALQAAASL